MKQKQYAIEDVGDLVDCLDEDVTSANEKLAELGSSKEISVELDCGRLCVKVDGKEEFSSPVNDGNARSMYNTASSAIKRAMKSIASSERAVAEDARAEAESPIERAFDRFFGENHQAEAGYGTARRFEKKSRTHYDGGKSFMDELIWTVNHANSRAGEEGMDFLFEYKLEGDHCVVTGNGELIVDVLADFDTGKVMTDEVFSGPMLKIKKSIWRRIDSMKKRGYERKDYRSHSQYRQARQESRQIEQKPKEPVAPPKRPFGERLNEIVGKANEELAKIDVEKLVVSSDSAALYILSGKIPVVSWPTGVKDDEAVLKSMNDKIWGFVHASKGAYERRKSDSERIGVLQYDTECDKAMYEKYNAKPADATADATADTAEKTEGNSEDDLDSGDWKYFHNPDVARDIVRAVKKAIRPFNRTSGIRFCGLATKIGEDEVKMSIRGFSRGVVVMAGGNPCYVTMFPLVGNNKTTEETIAYLEGALKGLCEKRMEYLNALKSEYERYDRLHDLSKRRDNLRKENEALEEALKAMAM